MLARTFEPSVGGQLWIQELDIQKEIKRHWQETSSYVTPVPRTTGISGVEAEELAILPGMEELSAMMYVNQYRREQCYDVIVLDDSKALHFRERERGLRGSNAVAVRHQR